MKKYVLILLMPLLISGCYKSNENEGPMYKVIDTVNNIEIREYDASIIAEVVVNGERDDAANEAFSYLFDYISGANISMTKPVTQQKDSVKIPMTAPVSQQKSEGDSWKIAFYMPNSYTMKTIPEPTDPKVKIKLLKSYKAAAVKFSGRWTDSNYTEHKEELIEYIKENKLKTDGEFIYAYYNAPITPWFMRRNEVIVKLN